MNREILFRGKRVDNDEWIEGYYVKYQPCASKDEFVIGIVPVCASDLYLTEVVPSTVGQFTGLTDKNGVKIFEGDILSAHFDEEYPENVTFMEVENNGFAFTLRQLGSVPRSVDKMVDGTDAKWCSDIFEAAGNIYDNPELMKGEPNV